MSTAAATTKPALHTAQWPAPVGGEAVVPGPLVAPAPGTDGAGPGAMPRLRLLRYEPEPGATALAADLRPRPPVAPVACRPPEPDDPREIAPLRWRAQQVLRLALETLDGRRPLSHLVPHVEPPVLRYVRAAHAQQPAVRHAARMTSLHVGRPTPDALEAAAVYRVHGRARALAARFEGRPEEPEGWRCVTLRLL